VDIAGANTSSLRFFPAADDFQARYRLAVTIPGKTIYSRQVNLTTGPIDTPAIAIASAEGKIAIHFTDRLQRSTTAAGPYTDVEGAASPYTVPSADGAAFFRSIR